MTADPTGNGGPFFEGVVLESVTGPVTPAVSDLSLQLDSAGITMSGPSIRGARHLLWSEVGSPRCRPGATMPNGTPAAAIAAMVGGRQVRWLVPADQLPPERAGDLDRILMDVSAPSTNDMAEVLAATAAKPAARPGPSDVAQGDDPPFFIPSTADPDAERREPASADQGRPEPPRRPRHAAPESLAALDELGPLDAAVAGSAADPGPPPAGTTAGPAEATSGIPVDAANPAVALFGAEPVAQADRPFAAVDDAKPTEPPTEPPTSAGEAPERPPNPAVALFGAQPPAVRAFEAPTPVPTDALPPPPVGWAEEPARTPEPPVPSFEPTDAGSPTDALPPPPPSVGWAEEPARPPEPPVTPVPSFEPTDAGSPTDALPPPPPSVGWAEEPARPPEPPVTPVPSFEPADAGSPTDALPPPPVGWAGEPARTPEPPVTPVPSVELADAGSPTDDLPPPPVGWVGEPAMTTESRPEPPVTPVPSFEPADAGSPTDALPPPPVGWAEEPARTPEPPVTPVPPVPSFEPADAGSPTDALPPPPVGWVGEPAMTTESRPEPLVTPVPSFEPADTGSPADALPPPPVGWAGEPAGPVPEPPPASSEVSAARVAAVFAAGRAVGPGAVPGGPGSGASLPTELAPSASSVAAGPTEALPPPPRDWSGPSSDTDPTARADLPPPPANWSGPSLDAPPWPEVGVDDRAAVGSSDAVGPGAVLADAGPEATATMGPFEAGTPPPPPPPPAAEIAVEPRPAWGSPYEGTTAPPEAPPIYGVPTYGAPGAYPGWPGRDDWAIATPHAPRRRRRWLVIVIVVVVLAAAAAGLAIGLTGSTSSAPPVSHPDGDRQVAQQIALTQGDLPSGWTVDHSSDGPLSGLLSTGNSALTPAEQQQAETISTQYEGCMGIPASEDRIFGSAGAIPTAQAASPAFAAPGAAESVEAGSTVDMFARPAAVQADEAQISAAGFPRCFGAALGQLLTAGSSTGTSSSVLIGTPQVQALTLAQQAGVRTVGVDLVIPVVHSGTSTPLQFGVVLIDGGRAEATLVTFASPGTFPSALTASLAGTLAAHVAAYGMGSGL